MFVTRRVRGLLAPRQAGKAALLHQLVVDVIAETSDGQVVGIEVKAALTVTGRDFKHLDTLKAKLGSDFVCGDGAYLGTSTLSFGDRLTAVRLGALWAKPPRSR